ncbi:MAG: type II toxin-antitoxin system ParD family antitoxin [Rhizobiaceae bacterium]|nr:MAG: type II toxin-antitoxin system ParD family antitoxin [Rhizobiaceae bacterium]
MTEIHLNDEDRAFVEDLVKHRVYRDADEVVAAGLRLLGSEEGRFIELQRLIEEGLEDVEAGRVHKFGSAEEMLVDIKRMAEASKTSAGN